MLLNYKQYLRAAGRRLSVNVGLGGLLCDDHIPGMRLDNGFNFGWNAGVSIDANTKLFGQFRFIAGSHPSDDGLAVLQLGYRF